MNVIDWRETAGLAGVLVIALGVVLVWAILLLARRRKLVAYVPPPPCGYRTYEEFRRDTVVPEGHPYVPVDVVIERARGGLPQNPGPWKGDKIAYYEPEIRDKVAIEQVIEECARLGGQPLIRNRLRVGRRGE